MPHLNLVVIKKNPKALLMFTENQKDSVTDGIFDQRCQTTSSATGRKRQQLKSAKASWEKTSVFGG